MNDRLDELDLSRSLSREESEHRVGAAQRRLLHLRLFSAGLLGPAPHAPGLLVLFEGFDAAGKGGAIRRLTAGLDPRHVRVVPIGPPNAEELQHHFLWRFSPSLPGRGEMTVYDRSWYGRLLVERVDGLIDTGSVKRSAKEIVDFESALVHDGVTLVKTTKQPFTLAAGSYYIQDGAGGYALISDVDPAYDVCSSPTDQILMQGRNIGDLLNARDISWGGFMGGFDLSTVNANGTTGCKRSSTSSYTGR